MSGPFNKKNPLGKHCIWALVPGWYDNDFTSNEAVAASGAAVGYLESIGQRQLFTDSYDSSGSDIAWARTVTKEYGHLGTLRAIEFETFGSHACKLRRVDGDEGIQFPNPLDLTIVGIIRPKGDGRGGAGSDPRIYSKDIGSATDDHDLMIGMAALGNEARTRIRLNGNTRTVLAGTAYGGMQDDALNLIAGGARQTSSSGCRATLVHIREDGKYNEEQYPIEDGGYDPRTTTNSAIGGNADAILNFFEGDIIGVWAFDKSLDVPSLQRFFANPWQVFAPQQIVMPRTGGRAVAAEEEVGGDVTGTIVETLADDTSVGTGSISLTGTLAETLGDATSTATGELENRGTIAETLGDTTSAATGELENRGTLAETLGDVTSAATGELENRGTLAQTLGDAVSTATGEGENRGSLAETLDDDTSVAAGEVGEDVTGTVAETLDDDTSVATGALENRGTLSETLADDTSAVSGELENRGTLAETLDDDTSAATGEQEAQGALAETLGDDTSVGTGEIYFLGSLAETLDDATSVATGEQEAQGTLAETLDDATVVGVGIVGDVINGTAAVTVGDDTSAAEGLRHIGGSLAEALGDDTSEVTAEQEAEGTLAETLGSVTSSITAEQEATGSVAETLGDDTSTGTGEIYYLGSVAQTLADVTSVASGELENRGSIAATTLDDDVVLGFGLVGEDINGTAAITLQDAVSSAVGELEITGTVAKVLLDDTTSATGVVTIEGAITISVGGDTLTAAGELQVSGTISRILGDVVSVAGGAVGVVNRRPNVQVTLSLDLENAKISYTQEGSFVIQTTLNNSEQSVNTDRPTATAKV